MKSVAKTILALCLFAIGAAVFGTVVARPLWPGGEPAGAYRRILVLANPIHTDIAVPLDAALVERFGFIREAALPIDAPGARYLIFGRGGRDFYLKTPTWSQLQLMPLLKGITLDRSVMHVELAGELEEGPPGVSGYDIGEVDYEEMLASVERSFSRGADGAPILIAGSGYGPYDTFYEADGYFTALLGCNIWAAKMLRTAGLRTGWWNPLPQSLAFSLWLYN